MLHCRNPEVGVKARFRKGIKVNDNDHTNLEMWAYPDGIKIYDNHLNIVNDSQPE